MHTVVEQALRTGSFHTHVLTAGPPDGPPVLLVHDGAWGADARTSWQALIPLLADPYRVIAPDMLGFGRTDKAVFFDQSRFAFRAAHLADVLRTLSIEGPVHAVGASFGGSLVLRAATRSPLQLRSVVSFSGTGGPWRNPDEFKKLVDYDGTEEAMRRIVGFLVDPYPGIDEQVRLRQENSGRLGHAPAMSIVRLEAVGDQPPPKDPADPYPESLEGCDLPLLLVEGARDVLLEDGWAEQLCARIGAGTAVRLDSLHSPNIDRPEESATLLRDFLKDH